MPLVLKENKDKYSLTIWKINEYLSFFLEKLKLCEEEKREISNYRSQRLLEWYASRYSLYLTDNDISPNCVVKNQNGKPFLRNSQKYISISHSQNYAGAILSDKQIGLDIQKISEKAQIVKNKFLSIKEMKFADSLIDLNCFWTIKEAVYKAYGKKNLVFKKNILILNYEKINKTKFKSRVLLNKNDLLIYYTIEGMILDKIVISIAMLNNNNNQ